jgi:signal transduction histidine kinase
MSEKAPRILIVDDIPENLFIVENVLQHKQCETVTATRGSTALIEAEKGDFDLILLDILMPEMDGFEVCNRLKRNPTTAHIPVIFLTALNDDDNILRGFEVGGVDYVTKPFRPAELTARVMTHVSLRRRETELASMSASKDKFISIIAEELRQPFGALRGVLRMLNDEYPGLSDDDRREYIELSYHNADNLYKLINGLMTWSSLQRGVLPFRPTAVDLQAAADDAIYQFADKIRRKKLEVAIHLPESSEAYADREMLDTILRNLIANAIMYNVEEGKIAIQAEQVGEVWRIEVVDTGIGIDEEDQKNLFRIDEEHRGRGTLGETGTGMGLILCKELVEKQGGEIDLISSGGETRARFTLPRFTARS